MQTAHCKFTGYPWEFWGSYLKGVDAGLGVVDDEEFGDQVSIFKFSEERLLRI
jgi:hypothetical protein